MPETGVIKRFGENPRPGAQDAVRVIDLLDSELIMRVYRSAIHTRYLKFSRIHYNDGHQVGCPS